MIRTCVLISTCATLLSAASAYADEQLPEDGSWARYHVVVQQDSGREHTFHQTIRFVKTGTRNGRTCRWIEFVDDVPQEKAAGKRKVDTFMHRFVIPEQSLRTSENPIRELVGGWSGKPGSPGEAFSNLARDRQVYNWSHGPQMMFLPGPMKSMKAVKTAKTVDYQGGRLSMKSGYQGKHTAKFAPSTSPVRYIWRTSVKFWRHPKVPLGPVLMEFETVMTIRDAKGKERVRRSNVRTYTIEAWGAKPRGKKASAPKP